MSFCHQHGFYDCPVCAGEPIEWTIPVVNSKTGEQTGTIRISEQGDAAVIGHIDWPVGEWEYTDVVQKTPSPALVVEAPPSLVVHEPPDPKLARSLEGLIPSIYEQMMKIPRWRKAAGRGRRLHEQALELAEEKGVSYQEALESLV